MRSGVTSLVQRTQSSAWEAMQLLAANSPTLRALTSGRIDREIYAAVLVQIFKVESVVSSVLHRLPDALLLSPYPNAPRPRGRRGALDELVIQDLSAIWHCPVSEAFARAFASASLPPVQLFEGTIETLLTHYAWALPGVAIVMDEWANVARAGATKIAESRPWPEATSSTQYLSAPSVRAEQLAAHEILDHVAKGNDERAVMSAVQCTVDMLRFLIAHFDESV